MYFKASLWSGERGLPVILLAAVVQGWALYGLHESIVASRWPATDPPLLLAFYAAALFVPLTLQFLAEHVRQRATWFFLACLGIALFYFGWHTGTVLDEPTRRVLASGEIVERLRIRPRDLHKHRILRRQCLLTSCCATLIPARNTCRDGRYFGDAWEEPTAPRNPRPVYHAHARAARH